MQQEATHELGGVQSHVSRRAAELGQWTQYRVAEGLPPLGVRDLGRVRTVDLPHSGRLDHRLHLVRPDGSAGGTRAARARFIPGHDKARVQPGKRLRLSLCAGWRSMNDSFVPFDQRPLTSVTRWATAPSLPWVRRTTVGIAV